MGPFGAILGVNVPSGVEINGQMDLLMLKFRLSGQFSCNFGSIVGSFGPFGALWGPFGASLGPFGPFWFLVDPLGLVVSSPLVASSRARSDLV